MYSSAENAFAALDFSGTGFVKMDSFLSSIVVKERVKFSKKELLLFFQENNMFVANSPGINFDGFKKYFFPSLYLVQEGKDDLDDIQAQGIR